MPTILDEPTTTTEAPSIQVIHDDRPSRDYREPGDSEKFAHYVDKNDAMAAYIEGTAIQALCGKTWVPTRDPSKFPVCPECQRLFDLGLDGRLREWQERSSSE